MTAHWRSAAADAASAFSRRDAARLAIASLALIVALGAILSLDFLPTRADVQLGMPAPQTIVAPATIDFRSDIETAQQQADAAAAVPPQYDYTAERADALATQQVAALRAELGPVDAAFAPSVSAENRRQTLQNVLPGLSDTARATLLGLDAGRWTAVREETARVLDQVERTEVRDSDVADQRAKLPDLMAGGLSAAEARLAAEVDSPFVQPNSSYSAALTQEAKQRAAQGVPPVHYQIRQGQVIVDRGHPVTELDMAKMQALGLLEPRFDLGRLVGWFLVTLLLVGLLLAWVWRFRREFWHRNNALVLVGLVLVLTTLALKLAAGRPVIPYIVPTAAAGMLIAILLDADAATVLMAVLAVIAGMVNDRSLELSSYVFLGGFAGIVMVRRGERLQQFVQAGLAVALVDVMVVSVFALFGEHDISGLVQLWGASAAEAGGSAVAAVGSFAVLGNLFGILTVFQLLELAGPSQPLLRRLLTETPGTYHHSLMVGNLAERAAAAIGADPLLTRVAAYYHDIGKLANPLAFIENQAGVENIHDQLEPEVSAQVLRQHVPDGIDIAYEARLPKTLIAFIPQHHGTALMSFFYAKARELAAAPFGGLETAGGRTAAEGVDGRRFRHSGPKPQSREAALLMLADGVEASVRSLSSRDEPAIRAMVGRIIEERLADGQFDECDLTIRDLERVREAFVQQLLGMYHQRIAYPQNKIVELEARRGSGAG
ncbi:MAG TPA: HDIG domain-containing protein [Candidatus Limnocylindrales bacterium]